MDLIATTIALASKADVTNNGFDFCNLRPALMETDL